ncbi:asparagine synthetase B [Desulfolithobacter dissulfuricans]|uniref:asparagine synthase (glutamine-hydrolyzing) n=1 Tax=Desulfolithobacter dissulfuricans TaxID=2795293 RepID=A0A915U4H4_9BACT|nr:asparagine synthase (glutamine-hydrolyzing) [Desulfolithobacter dissulfuricans]BCO07657.1 asparagine synthetase B [Desulfolithobacter dissulfuricans]
MCGIAGYFRVQDNKATFDLRSLERMIWSLRHRGPDGFGFFQDQRTGLAHARLSIIDLEGGWQPIHNEDKTLWVVFNGEIFNYPELRQDLIARGHRFATDSDTEVIVHLYEEKGPDCLEDLNGQFAIALYDQKEQALFLARDRMGIRPLFYTRHDGHILFGSEIKALFSASPAIPRQLDPQVLREIFTFWSPAGRETVFQGVFQLEPGCWLRVDRNGETREEQYWDIPFSPASCSLAGKEEHKLAGQLRELLVDSVRLRLRADVPVGAYLSGGLDSSAITSLIKHYTDNELQTFSVTFADKVYDEQAEQQQMAEFLGTHHQAIRCDYQTIARAFPDVIWHTETPILRTAPTPLYLLSSLVRENRYKVVLTGEGADEILGGYDIFKEAKIRAFIGSQPDSSCRPFLLRRLYPYLALSPARSAEYARKFFDTAAPVDDPFYAHRPRWKTTSGTQRFFSPELLAAADVDPVDKLGARWGKRLAGLDFFTRAQYLESKMLLGNYLLSSQGDRMAMAHSVEGRFPFLDHRVVELAATMSPQVKMKVLSEKNILKKAMADILPEAIVQRKKQPYMAPDIISFFGEESPAYLDEYLEPSRLRDSGLFQPAPVEKLVAKCRRKARQGFRENMAFVGILSTMILHHRFVENFSADTPETLPGTRILVGCAGSSK